MNFGDLYDVIQEQQKVRIRTYFESEDSKDKVIYSGNIDLLPHSIYERIYLDYVSLIEMNPHMCALDIYLEPYHVIKEDLITYGKE